jgi:hypothetical protein
MTATPQPTDHVGIYLEDPRTLTAQLSGNIEEKWR